MRAFVRIRIESDRSNYLRRVRVRRRAVPVHHEAPEDDVGGAAAAGHGAGYGAVGVGVRHEADRAQLGKLEVDDVAQFEHDAGRRRDL